MALTRSRRPRVAFLPAHPKQLWMLRPVAEYLKGRIEPVWVLRDKDVLIDLADGLGLPFRILSKASPSRIRAAATLGWDTLKVWHQTRREGISAWVTKYGAGNLGARLCGRPSFAFNDDDADVVPFVAWTSYPFADWVAVTQWTRMGRFERKARRYTGFQELFYLHPNRFSPDPTVRKELGVNPGAPFVLLRLSALASHHDVGVRGVDDTLVRQILRLCKGRVQLVISSERALGADLDRYRASIPVERIHHALAASALFIGDSQSMTGEAAMLGTPALRLSDFVGRIGSLAELERRRLAFGYTPDQTSLLLSHVDQLLSSVGPGVSSASEEFQQRREQLFADCPDPVPWFAENIMAALNSRLT